MPSVTDFTSEAQMRALADARGWSDGMALADSNSVVFEEVTPERVTAVVNAPDGPARVELTAVGSRFGYDCSCWEIPEACRHVVAAAMALPRYHAPEA
jgi:uncharacterized Zn finger protein